MAKAAIVGRKFMVRPKGKSAFPCVQVWVVLREDPETGEVDQFLVNCVEGHFFAHYRSLGLIDGRTPFDPYLDMDEGRMTRKLIATY